MPAFSHNRQPKYRHYKAKDLAVVRIGGRDFYLGKFDSPESRQKYYKLMANQGSASGDHESTVLPGSGGYVGIATVVEAYLLYAETYYGKKYARTSELDNLEYALEPLCDHFGTADANVFGPKSLMQVREHMSCTLVNLAS